MKCRTVILLGIVCSVCHLFGDEPKTGAPTMELGRLYQPPEILSVDKHEEYNVEGCQAIIFEGERFKGEPVSLFAYYSTPAGAPPAEGWPAVVLVHGGGGTAFANYVEDWNEKGYAAISLDWYGLFPEIKKKTPERRKVVPNTVAPLYSYEDAVANIIRCHSLLRSFPRIDVERTGIVGASWGGFFALTAAGYDQRFKCVISAYAAGFWQKTPFDPQHHVMNITAPVLRTAVVNELNFPLPRWQETVDLTTSAESTLSIDLARGHSNVGLVWPINYHFADMTLKGQGLLPRIGSVRQTGDKLEATVMNIAQLDQSKLGRAELHYAVSAPTARGGRFYEKDQWQKAPVERVHGLLQATVPVGTRACFLNLFWNDLPISSQFLLLGSVKSSMKTMKRD
ncbi:MAG: alpha/beta fold hydrolase [Lentisphaerae bacterium]|jgi:dienelactone hydrolase|nr:alpha/beta fold hydrolase [Lentisphaerota bacterium]